MGVVRVGVREGHEDRAGSWEAGRWLEGAYQQVGPALPASQSNQQHLLDQRQLPLACGLFLSDFTLCSGLSKRTVHQDPLAHREVLN